VIEPHRLFSRTDVTRATPPKQPTSICSPPHPALILSPIGSDQIKSFHPYAILGDRVRPGRRGARWCWPSSPPSRGQRRRFSRLSDPRKVAPLIRPLQSKPPRSILSPPVLEIPPPRPKKGKIGSYLSTPSPKPIHGDRVCPSRRGAWRRWPSLPPSRGQHRRCCLSGPREPAPS
jgi:hypothetical protein